MKNSSLSPSLHITQGIHRILDILYASHTFWTLETTFSSFWTFSFHSSSSCSRESRVAGAEEQMTDKYLTNSIGNHVSTLKEKRPYPCLGATLVVSHRYSNRGTSPWEHSTLSKGCQRCSSCVESRCQVLISKGCYSSHPRTGKILEIASSKADTWNSMYTTISQKILCVVNILWDKIWVVMSCSRPAQINYALLCWIYMNLLQDISSIRCACVFSE